MLHRYPGDLVADPPVLRVVVGQTKKQERKKMHARHRAVIARLQNGETVSDYREGGNSMTPIIKHRQPVTIKPVDVSKLEKGDVVLCKVRGNVYTHKVVGLREGQAQIGNNHGRVNGWTSLNNVFGIVVSVEGRALGGAEDKVLTQE